MAEPLHLIRIPFRADALAAIAKERRLSLRDLDDGHLAHQVLRELWQQRAPAPFLLRGRGRRVEAWGYAPASAQQLQEHASSFGDPSLVRALDGGFEAIASKPMPQFARGRRLGFLVRACPIVRLSSGRGGQKGREVDAFLARCWALGNGVDVSREEVYRDWLKDRLTPDRTGTEVEFVRIDGFQRERFVRRTQRSEAGARQGKQIERPDVRMSGVFTVQDPVLFDDALRRGIGRHKAFGFGMLLLVPPGEAWATREHQAPAVEQACR